MASDHVIYAFDPHSTFDFLRIIIYFHADISALDSDRRVLALSVIVALPVWGWERTRSVYRQEADAIRQRIASAPKLHHVNDPPSAILVRGYSFPEADFGVVGCFDQLFLNAGSYIGKWQPAVGNRRVNLPDRYVELDADDGRHSPFGNRQKTGCRGPYDLWLVEGNRRSLVEVFFLKGTGGGWFPLRFLFVGFKYLLSCLTLPGTPNFRNF